MGQSDYKGGVFSSNRSPDHLMGKNYDSTLNKSPYAKSHMGLQYSQNKGAAVSEFGAMQGHLLTDGN